MYLDWLNSMSFCVAVATLEGWIWNRRVAGSILRIDQVWRVDWYFRGASLTPGQGAIEQGTTSPNCSLGAV